MKAVLYKVSIIIIVWTSLAGAQKISQIEAIPRTPEAQSIIRFSLELESLMDSTWYCGIVFPEEFGLTNVLFADSRKINGGFSIEVSGDTIWVRRSGKGDPILPSEEVDLMVAMVKLPGDVEKVYLFRFLTSQKSNIETTPYLIGLSGQ